MSQLDELVASFAAAKLESEADVQHAVSNAAATERAIIFIHVDWAPMEPQRTRFAQFALAYQQEHPENNVQFHYVDCTPVSDGYAPLKALPGWMELQSAAGVSLIHGWGELVWIDQGRVLHVQRILDFDSISVLVTRPTIC